MERFGRGLAEIIGDGEEGMSNFAYEYPEVTIQGVHFVLQAG